ncbi:U6 snRNA-associated Sm-like protein LSm2 [Nematocida homosporus]|uniref:U6 snRNA-associated Sm-like protein LSm2 n=1 Tax=Nematocida homosporus TaxID=1912981 RepID=UPI002220A86A|nr:U6 snRNA-associated Sm-like protein LSm2 [Nematocida homosporus]KAI5184615.1 U6 snRNA-associated Sm-like protein LSm2 [Nematocida homosporus]
MPLHAMFRSLTNKRIRVTLKNNIVLSGILIDIDTFSNIKLSQLIIEENPDTIFIPFTNTQNIFLRGSAIHHIWIKEQDVQMNQLEDSVRKTLLYRSLTATESEKDP